MFPSGGHEGFTVQMTITQGTLTPFAPNVAPGIAVLGCNISYCIKTPPLIYADLIVLNLVNRPWYWASAIRWAAYAVPVGRTHKAIPDLRRAATKRVKASTAASNEICAWKIYTYTKVGTSIKVAGRDLCSRHPSARL